MYRDPADPSILPVALPLRSFSVLLLRPHLVGAAYWHRFEMDIALYFPEFFNDPVEYGGAATIAG